LALSDTNSPFLNNYGFLNFSSTLGKHNKVMIARESEKRMITIIEKRGLK